MENLDEVIGHYGGQTGMLLVALQEIQALVGFVPEQSIDAVSKALQIPPGEVQSVLSFYTELRTTPPGKHRLCVCNGDSCAATGSHTIAQSVQTYLGTAPNTVTADGRFSYDVVYCLGNCALSPSIAIDDEVYGKCTSERVKQLLRAVTDG